MRKVIEMARIALESLIKRSLRNMGNVHPAVKSRVLYLIEKAYEEGINVQISSGYRSFDEQRRLYRQGRYGNGGSVVTNAEPGQSVHNYGLAVDYFLTNDDGTKAMWEVNEDWRRVAEIGKSLGFSWGGDWERFKDYPHLELTGNLGWRDLKAGERPHNLLNEGVMQEGHAGMEVAELQEALQKLGYDLQVDGVFGPVTDRVVKEFQTRHGLIADGLFCPKSKSALRKALIEEKNEPVYVSSWAKADWIEATENGYFDGTRPKEALTREEAAIVVNRLRHNFLERMEQNEQKIEKLENDIERLRKQTE